MAVSVSGSDYVILFFWYCVCSKSSVVTLYYFYTSTKPSRYSMSIWDSKCQCHSIEPGFYQTFNKYLLDNRRKRRTLMYFKDDFLVKFLDSKKDIFKKKEVIILLLQMKNLWPGGFFGDTFRGRLEKNVVKWFHISWKQVDDVQIPGQYFEGEMWKKRLWKKTVNKLLLL